MTTNSVSGCLRCGHNFLGNWKSFSFVGINGRERKFSKTTSQDYESRAFNQRLTASFPCIAPYSKFPCCQSIDSLAIINYFSINEIHAAEFQHRWQSMRGRRWRWRFTHNVVATTRRRTSLSLGFLRTHALRRSRKNFGIGGSFPSDQITLHIVLGKPSRRCHHDGTTLPGPNWKNHFQSPVSIIGQIFMALESRLSSPF